MNLLHCVTVDFALSLCCAVCYTDKLCREYVGLLCFCAIAAHREMAPVLYQNTFCHSTEYPNCSYLHKLILMPAACCLLDPLCRCSKAIDVDPRVGLRPHSPSHGGSEIRVAACIPDATVFQLGNHFKLIQT